MKRTFLAKLQRSALYCLIGALLLVVGVPLYQLVVLNPAGYSDALTSLTQTLHWINDHGLLFVGYRALLLVGFALMLGIPFALYRIIVAQEIIGRTDIEENEVERQAPGEQAVAEKTNSDAGQVEQEQQQENKSDGMPEFAWRGKGYAVIAAWTGLPGLIFFAAGTLASTIYLLS